MSASPVLGRNARLLKDGVAIGYGRNITTDADAEEIKVYSNDSLKPALTAAGKQNFKWSMERLFTDATYLQLLLDGTEFDLIFAPENSPLDGTKYETWKNCKILHRGTKSGEDDGIVENLSGSAEDIELPA
jgi:hypothetical protein